MSVNKTVENVYLRQDALQLTRKHFWPLLGMLLLSIFLPALLEYGLTALGDQLMIPEVSAVVEQYTHLTTSDRLTSSEPMLEAVIGLLTSPKYLLFNLVYVCVTGLFSAALTLGHTAQMISVARGGAPKVLGIFGRMQHCIKAWLLELWTGFKVALWLLPGVAVILLGAELTLYDLGSLGNGLMVLGVGLLIGLTIPAAYRYFLAPYIMADEPDHGVRECVTLSKGLMKDCKWQCFKLTIPALLKLLGLIYLFLIIGGLLLVGLGLEESSVANDVLTYAIYIPTAYFFIQVNLVQALFYLKRRQPAPDAPVSYWLKDHPEADPADAAPVSAWLQEHLATDIEPDAEAEPTDTPEESNADSPEDTSPETNEKKENPDEQPVC